MIFHLRFLTRDRAALQALASSRWTRCRGSETLVPGEFTKRCHMMQCETPKIAKLVPITPITMVYGIYNYSIL